MLSLGRILKSELVVADVFMHLLPGMILLYLATPFYTKDFFHEIKMNGSESRPRKVELMHVHSKKRDYHKDIYT